MKTPEGKEQMNIEITKARVEDIPEIAQVRKEGWLATYVNKEHGITKEDLLGEDFESPERIQRWQEFTKNPDVYHIVAKDNGKVVGFVIARKQEGVNRLRALYVSPDYHNMGIGKKLMSAALEWLGDEKEVKLHVAAFNEKAISFYEKFGFEKGEKLIPGPEDLLKSRKAIPEIEMIKNNDKEESI